ncbi:ABC transporter permease [Candidatus Kaiserbacteria bacterium]|nr:ABC transporter permease [Candidatus Kaiserbacteria bacterium]
MFTEFKRIVHSGFVGFWRNAFVTLTSVLVMTVALFMVATTIFSDYSLESALSELQQKVDVNVYFVTTAAEEEVLSLKTSLEALPDVREVVYTSREDALTEFRNRHRNDELTIQALEELGENPLGASLSIRAQETSQYESIAAFLDEQQDNEDPANPRIDRINFFQNKAAIDKLTDIIDQERSKNGTQAIVLVLIAAFVVFNTIRLVIHNAREEIAVMRLVGASNFFISAPFVISGITQGLISSVLVLIVLYPTLLYREEVFYPFPFFGESDTSQLLFSYFVTDFGHIFLMVVGGGVLIGAIASFLSVRRYLKV